MDYYWSNEGTAKYVDAGNKHVGESFLGEHEDVWKDRNGNTHVDKYICEDLKKNHLCLFRHWFRNGIEDGRITVGVYCHQPTKDNRNFDFCWKKTNRYIIPIVFADNNGKPGRCLVDYPEAIDFNTLNPNFYTQWLRLNTRIGKNTYLHVGFYCHDYIPRWDENFPMEINYYECDANHVNDPITYINNGSMVNNARLVETSHNFPSFYINYFGAPLSINFIRYFDESSIVTDICNRKFAANRKYEFMENIGVVDYLSNKKFLKRLVETNFYIAEKIYKALRFVLKTKEYTFCLDSSTRNVNYKRIENIGCGFFDRIKCLHTIICSVVSPIFIAAIPGRIINYIRLQKQKAKYKTMNNHSSNYIRDNSSISKVGAKAISSRTLTRICNSVSFFWDFLRGKIRETPNVVTLFCPVDLEVEFESRI